LWLQTASPAHVTCRVDVGGTLSDRKGVNTPSIVLPISPLTPKDREDLAHALDMDVDWVALRCRSARECTRESFTCGAVECIARYG
jgi:pyruvate kinase